MQSARCMSNLLIGLAVLMVGLWALGLATAHTMGGFVHVLLVVALIAVVARLIMGRQALGGAK